MTTNVPCSTSNDNPENDVRVSLGCRMLSPDFPNHKAEERAVDRVEGIVWCQWHSSLTPSTMGEKMLARWLNTLGFLWSADPTRHSHRPRPVGPLSRVNGGERSHLETRSEGGPFCQKVCQDGGDVSSNSFPRAG